MTTREDVAETVDTITDALKSLDSIHDVVACAVAVLAHALTKIPAEERAAVVEAIARGLPDTVAQLARKEGLQ